MFRLAYWFKRQTSNQETPDQTPVRTRAGNRATHNRARAHSIFCSGPIGFRRTSKDNASEATSCCMSQNVRATEALNNLTCFENLVPSSHYHITIAHQTPPRLITQRPRSLPTRPPTMTRRHKLLFLTDVKSIPTSQPHLKADEVLFQLFTVIPLGGV